MEGEQEVGSLAYDSSHPILLSLAKFQKLEDCQHVNMSLEYQTHKINIQLLAFGLLSFASVGRA